MGRLYLLDKVCHDFDIFGRLTGARAAKVASFGGRSIFTPAQAERPKVYSDGAPAYALRDAGWSAANDAFHSDMDVTDHQTAMVEYANGVRLSFHANSHTALQERRWYLAGTRGTLLADLVRNRLMVRGALDRGSQSGWTSTSAPTTTTTAPTRPWPATSWPPCRERPSRSRPSNRWRPG